MPEWTQKQKAAIASRNHSILVSAAAGSGKTAVLIERILALLREGIDIEQMLVVTFTKAAAGEMRERLQKALTRESRGDAALRAQRARIGSADISTLHQFCIKLIRRHFQVAGTDPESAVGDAGLLSSLQSRALDEEMELLYAQPDEDARRLIEQYEDAQIEEMARSLYTFLRAQEAPWEWLEKQLELAETGRLSDFPWYGQLREAALREAERALSLTERCLELTQRPQGPARYDSAAKTDREMARAILDALRQQGELPEDWKAELVRLPGGRIPEGESPELRAQFQALRSEAKKSLEEALGLLPRGEAAKAKAAADIFYTLPALRALSALTRRMHERYGEYKRRRQLWDFSDLEHLALACLKDPLVRAREQRHYKALFVDEYQDISRIQEAIIRLLHGEESSLFMVGDVKQSIYRFRLAEPGLFLDKYSRFDEDEQAAERVITLSQNFRSRDNILLCVNHVFDHTLSGGALEIGYGSEERLYPGHHSAFDPPVELHLIVPSQGEVEEEESAPAPEDAQEEEGAAGDDSGETPAACEREALLMAQLMHQLRGSPVREGEGTRPMSWRDMVILLRSASGRAGMMARVLTAQGIPVYSDADRQFFDLIEVSDVLNLLHVLDNPYDDERLLAALAAPPFEFGPIELERLRSLGDRNRPVYEVFFSLRDSEPLLKDALDTMDSWRLACQNRPLDSFLRWLLRETGIYARAGAKPEGELRRGNLRLLCERAGPNPLPQTLHGFLARVKEARQDGESRAAATLGAGEDVVRIMTIHKSKGLEFPLVFLPDLSHRFRTGRQRDEQLLLDSEEGAALRLVDPEKRLTFDTLWGKAIQLKKAGQTRAEEARLLYVAMTRAKERLILLSSPRSIDSERAKWQLACGSGGADKASSMLEWVGASLWPALESGENAFYEAPGGGHFDLFWHGAGQLRMEAPALKDPAFPPLGSEKPSEEIKAMLAPLPKPAGYPMKLSVTQLTHRNAAVEEETAGVKRLPLEELLQPASAQTRLPGAERGTAAHKALGSLPLAALRGLSGEALLSALKKELDSLKERHILSEAERGAVEPAALARFYESGLGQRLLRAGQAEREWPFTLACENGLILQGVLDCCFLEEGGWVLIDYKTDRAAPETIESRYRDQLRWYMRALRDITGQPVKNAYLYALQYGGLIEVTEEKPITYQESAAENTQESGGNGGCTAG